MKINSFFYISLVYLSVLISTDQNLIAALPAQTPTEKLLTRLTSLQNQLQQRNSSYKPLPSITRNPGILLSIHDTPRLTQHSSKGDYQFSEFRADDGTPQHQQQNTDGNVATTQSTDIQNFGFQDDPEQQKALRKQILLNSAIGTMGTITILCGLFKKHGDNTADTLAKISMLGVGSLTAFCGISNLTKFAITQYNNHRMQFQQQLQHQQTKLDGQTSKILLLETRIKEDQDTIAKLSATSERTTQILSNCIQDAGGHVDLHAKHINQEDSQTLQALQLTTEILQQLVTEKEQTRDEGKVTVGCFQRSKR